MEWGGVGLGGRPLRGLTVVLVLLLLVVLHDLRHPETLLEEVDQGLAQVLPCPLAVQEVSLIWVDLWTYAKQRVIH